MTYNFPSPFNSSSYQNPRSLPSKTVVKVNALIKSKPSWNFKINDAVIVSKWRTELKEQDLSEEIIQYALDECKYWSSLPFVNSNALPSSVDGVWICDDNNWMELRNSLISAVLELETSLTEKDWHPNSNEQVLNFIHPSLYPLVHGLSFISKKECWDQLENPSNWKDFLRESYLIDKSEKFIKNESKKRSSSDHEFTSRHFQWLPSEFKIDEKGTATIETYINNLHPLKFNSLYKVIARVFSCFIPLFENVLTDSLSPPQTRTDDSDLYKEFWDENDNEGLDDSEYEKKLDEWNHQRKSILLPFEPVMRHPQVSLCSSNLQVIVKISSIILTPEKPTYPGGTWHVEGMTNESIVASAIYYFQQENIEESELEFRVALEEFSYNQGDDYGVEEIYGLQNEDMLCDHLGGVKTLEGRLLCFPNYMQHHVKPFSLKEKSKSGFRKILVFFLVDPDKKITSTLSVPPQQQSWVTDQLNEDIKHNSLPDGISRQIVDMANYGISMKTAKKLREMLMEERKYLTNALTNQVYEREFSLCEH